MAVAGPGRRWSDDWWMVGEFVPRLFLHQHQLSLQAPQLWPAPVDRWHGANTSSSRRRQGRETVFTSWHQVKASQGGNKTDTFLFFHFSAFFQLGMQNVFPENLLINLVHPAWKEAPCSFWTGEAKTWQGKHSVMSHFGTREFASPARGLWVRH